MKVEPSRGVDATSSVPPCASTIARLSAKPSPDPGASGSRRTPSSKIRARSSRGMPGSGIRNRDLDAFARRREPNRHGVGRARVCECVRNKVVEDLPKAYRIGVRDDRAVNSLRDDVRPTHGKCCDDIACESCDVDGLHAHRVDSDIQDDALDRARGSEREPHEVQALRVVGRYVRDGLRDGGQRSDGAPNLMYEECESRVVEVRSHSCCSANRRSAQRAVSARTASSSSTYRETLGASAGLPTLPAATRALRRSQRTSLRGT